MERIITIKGIGKVRAKPERIVLSIQIKSQDKNYEKTMQLADDQMDKLRKAVVQCGFDKSDLKTENFIIDTNYDNIRDKNGNYRRVFKGYVCEHQLKLQFDLEKKLLAKVLFAFTESQVNPEFSIRFTVADPDKLTNDLLVNATKNALVKANTIAQAADVTLGKLLNIHYSWGEIDVYSHTKPMIEKMELVNYAYESPVDDIEPEDIQLSDTVTFVWEIN